MYKLFGIPNCDTVKKAKTFLLGKGIPHEFIDFKKTPPLIKDIIRWREAFGDLPVNIQGTTYRKYKDEFEALSGEAKIEFLVKNSSMIKRPVLEKDGLVLALGFKEDLYKKILI